jgi:hypothetical protein
MSFRTTALLFGILIGVLWLFGLMLTLQKTKVDERLVLPTLGKEKNPSINKVEIKKGDLNLTFVKGTAGWEMTISPHSQKLRADDNTIQGLINTLIGLQKKEAPDLTQNPSQWGLAPPSETITLTSTLGRSWSVNLGKTSPDGSYVYVNSSDRPDSVLAVLRRDLKDALVKSNEVNRFRSQQLLDASDFNTRSVDLKPAASVKGRELALEKTKDSTWRFLKPPYGVADFEGNPKSTDPSGVRGLLNTVGAIRVEKESDFEPLGKEVFPESKALLVVQVERTGERGKKGAKETLLIGEKANKDQYYARLKGDESVVRVGARNVDILLDFTRKPDTLRSHDLAQVDTAGTDVVRISSGKGLADVVTLYRPEPGEWKVTAPGLRHRADEATIKGDKGLLTALQGKGQVKEFFDSEDKAKDKEMGFDSPKAKVEVWVDGLEKAPKKSKDDKKAAKKTEPKKGEKEGKKADKEAKKTDKDTKEEKPADEPRLNPKVKPAVTLIFGKKAGEKGSEVVYIKRELADGSVTRVAVPASLLDRVTPAEGALAYLDHNIAPFLAFDVERLELKTQDGKQVFVVEREPEKKAKGKEKFPLPGGWLLREPRDLKDRPKADPIAVQNVLGSLARLTVEKWERKVEDKNELKPYGLNAPAVVATVTLKKEKDQKEPKRYTYKFGSPAKAEKGKAAGVYGILTGSSELKDIVFVAPGEIMKTLQEAEFRDRTVLRFNPAEVKELKVKIRKEVTYTLIFQRKDDTWVLTKGPEEFMLQPGRVYELLNPLSDLDALRYVTFKGPEKGQGLEEGKPKIEIEVIMKDKTTYTLKIGAEPPSGNGYYAESSALPKAVFVVAAPTFSPLINEGVSFFSRKR